MSIEDGYKVTKARKEHTCSHPHCQVTIKKGDTYYRSDLPIWMRPTPEDDLDYWWAHGRPEVPPDIPVHVFILEDRSVVRVPASTFLDKLCVPCFEMTGVEILAKQMEDAEQCP